MPRLSSAQLVVAQVLDHARDVAGDHRLVHREVSTSVSLSASSFEKSAFVVGLAGDAVVDELAQPPLELGHQRRALALSARRAHRGSVACSSRTSVLLARSISRSPTRSSIAQNAIIRRCTREIAAIAENPAPVSRAWAAGRSLRSSSRSRRSDQVALRRSETRDQRATAAAPSVERSRKCRSPQPLEHANFALTAAELVSRPGAAALSRSATSTGRDRLAPIVSDKCRPGLFHPLERHRERRLELLREQRDPKLLEQPAKLVERRGRARPAARSRSRALRVALATIRRPPAACRASRSGPLARTSRAAVERRQVARQVLRAAPTASRRRSPGRRARRARRDFRAAASLHGPAARLRAVWPSAGSAAAIVGEQAERALGDRRQPRARPLHLLVERLLASAAADRREERAVGDRRRARRRAAGRSGSRS